jgi:preprotein translocase subunit SecY
MDKVTRYLAIAVTVLSAVMICLNWDNHNEASAWIVAFTGWVTYTLEMFGKKS